MTHDQLLRAVVNARTDWLRKSYKKARWKRRYTRWYKNESDTQLRCLLNDYDMKTPGTRGFWIRHNTHRKVPRA